MQIKVINGVLARKNANDKTSTDPGFVPLAAGVYRLGDQVGDRLEVLRGEKPTVYLPLKKLQEYEVSGEVQIIRNQ